MNTFSGKILKLKRYSYNANDFYYEKLFTEYDNLEIFNIYFNAPGKAEISTQVDILFRNEIAFGCDYNEVLSKLGKPDCHYHKADEFNYKILFYRFKLGGHKTKCELHFIDDELFFFNYIFSYISLNDKNELIRLLSLKYLNNPDMNITEIKVLDKNHNFILADDSIDFFVRYMWGHEEVKLKINHITGNAKRIIDEKMKLRFQELYRNL